MILYVDTSALVKLHVLETGSEVVQTWRDSASVIATALITYAEARAAFARAHRLGAITADAHRGAIRSFDQDWSRYDIVALDDALVRRAAGLAERYGLRGYDAVQLASALEVRPRDGTLAFASFDDRLNRAAVREGLVLPPEPELVADRPRLVATRRRAG